mmetsp:Transcript_8088/g.20617  ORF Transcript_8088/g.20617 Transcript_8088/m.20617 type:complete len:231 (+) Transcript_8088:238-930(+)
MNTRVAGDAALSAANSEFSDSWPAHTTTWSTFSTCGLPLTVTCKPWSSTLSYATERSIWTPRSLSCVRLIQPVVLPSPPPTLVSLRCSKKISRGEQCEDGREESAARPPRCSLARSMRHSAQNSSTDLSGASPGSGPVSVSLPRGSDRNSATSNPMPPAPMMATRFPTATAPLSTSVYPTTLGWSAPGNFTFRGTTPVATTTWVKSPRSVASTGVLSFTLTLLIWSCLSK